MAHPLVLLVDDDADTRDMYRLTLEMSSYRVVEAATVQAGIAAAAAHRPDVIVTDWLLTDGDGFALLDALRRSAPRTPKIAVTGMALDARAVGRAAALGCATVLTKPVSVDEFVAAIGEALEARTSRRLRAAALWAARAAGKGGTPSSIVAAGSRSSDVAVILADDTGQCVAANAGATSLTGYDAAQLTTMSVWDLTAAANSTAACAQWQQFRECGCQEGRYTVRHRNGESVESRYVAVANVAPGLHLSALAAATVVVAFA